MMQILVRGVLVFDLTGSFAALGVVALASAIPQLTIGLYGGVLADRFPKQLVVQVGQLFALATVVILGLITIAGGLAFWHLIMWGVAQGFLIGMMMPARQAMVLEVVGRERLMNAVSLNTGVMNTTQIAAPAVGAVLLATVGPGATFFAMAGCYVFAILTMTRVPRAPAALQGSASGWRNITDGVRYIRGNRPLLLVLLLSFFVSALGMPYMQILPGFVGDIFADGRAETARILGLLTSVSAAGALAGALVLATLPSRRRGLLLIGGGFILGVGLLAFSLSTVLWVSVPVMVVIGIGQSLRQSVANVLLQTYAEDAYRGRVMSVFMTQFAMMSLGAFAMGLIASAVGIQIAFAGMAVGLLAVSTLALLLLPGLRQLR